MRLLKRLDNSLFSLTEFAVNKVPPYAILSHTWGADSDEITMEDLRTGAGKHKAGYRKLQFCSDQAVKDHLHYFWVDTCCIDKSSSAELAEAINSMFVWYRDAARCYVYLSNVSAEGAISSTPSLQPWLPAFQQSPWFRRGWTLQELIAPKSVEFFSNEGMRLGDRDSMVHDIHDITNISIDALQGAPLHTLTVDERMSWAKHRRTTRAEDAAYSLLGIFDVHMPLIYGEGRTKALARLQKEIDSASNKADLAVSGHETSKRSHNASPDHGSVFYGPVTGRYVVAGSHITGGTVNFNFPA